MLTHIVLVWPALLSAVMTFLIASVVARLGNTSRPEMTLARPAAAKACKQAVAAAAAAEETRR
jgi:hypothetical protein